MKIRSRLFLVFIILMAVGLFSFVRWMQGEMRPRYMEAQEDALVDTANLLGSLLSTQAVNEINGKLTIDTALLHDSVRQMLKRNPDAQIYEVHKQQIDMRIYVTDATGKVIFDSDAGRDLHADYSTWRDVSLTLKGEYGARSTDFDPMYTEGSTMYIAAPVIYNDEIIGVVSVGKPTRNAERFMEHLLDNISSVGLLILAVSLLIGLIVNGWISRPLSRLQQYANAVIRGERISLPPLGNNEMGDVGNAMESMRIALDGKSYVSDYVQSLTHEIKGPVSAILGAAELLDENMPANARQRFIGNIRSQAKRLQELVDRLLELATLEYRPKLENTDTFNVYSLLSEVCEAFAPLTEQQHKTLQLHADANLTIEADRFLLGKAVVNIVKNAIEFSAEGGVIEVHAFEQHEQLEIRVCDSGTGIPDYAKKRIFERFFSLARPAGEKGSGLGLSFVREIAALHHGRVEVRDNPAATQQPGTCISLQLPVSRKQKDRQSGGL